LAIDTFYTAFEKVDIYERKNVALGKPATSSDNLNGSFTPEKAFDGSFDGSSRWVSSDNNAEHWIEVDLGQEFEINGFQIWNGAGGNFDFSIPHFIIQKKEGSEWIDISMVKDNTSAIVSRDFETTTARIVRMYIPAYSGNMARLYELAIYNTTMY
jgi:hypothetical protein